MLVKCSVNSIEIENISHSVTLVPRLKYSMNILDDVIDILNDKQIQIKKSNQDLIYDFDESNKLHINALKLRTSCNTFIRNSALCQKEYGANF